MAHQLPPSSPPPPPPFSGLPCPKVSCNDSSATSTPFVSAPSSPRMISTPSRYCFTPPALTFSAPSLQTLHILEFDAVSSHTAPGSTSPSSLSLSDFEFSSRFSEADASFCPNSIHVAPPMSTAEELFHNGRIRPLNTRSCSSSYCACFSDASAMLHDDYHNLSFQDACHPGADGPLSAHAEQHHPHQQHPSMTKQVRLGQADPRSTPSVLEQWKQSMGKYDMEHLRHAHGHHAERVIHITDLPLACYRNSRREGTRHHRRTRSLSPRRVFHMDDKVMQGRASFDSERHTSTNILHSVDRGTNMRSRKSWTLKELLSMGEKIGHDKRRQLRQIGTESAKSSRSANNKGRMEKSGVSWQGSSEDEKWHSKSSTNNEGSRSPWDLQQAVEEHGDQYGSSVGGYHEEGQVDQEIRKRTLLPYKKGLMGCLGFNSKLNSLKGLQSCMGP